MQPQQLRSLQALDSMLGLGLHHAGSRGKVCMKLIQDNKSLLSDYNTLLDSHALHRTT